MSYFCGNQQNTSSAAWRGWLCRGAFEGALQALATEGASSFLGGYFLHSQELRYASFVWSFW